LAPGRGGKGVPRNSLGRPTAALEEGGLGGGGGVVGGGCVTIDFPMISGKPICRFPILRIRLYIKNG